MPVTIKDVAKMAGVSISTVSRVINESKPVSDAIKERVYKVIEETGYVPNPVARSLVMKKSQLIGIIAPDLSDGMIGSFLNGIEEIARMYDYDSLICTTYNDEDKLNYYINLLMSKQVAGIIMVGANINQEANQKLIKYKVPTVYYGKDLASTQDVNYVDIDKNKAFEELIDMSYKGGKLLFLAKENQDSMGQDSDDEQIMKKKLKEKNMSCEFLRVSDYRDECYKELTKKLKKEKISAIISSSDEKTMATIYAATDLGIEIPRDLKLAQLYDSHLTRLIRPSITSIQIPYYDIGAVCARMVVKQIDAKEKENKSIAKTSNMILQARVKKGESTK